MSKKKEHDAFMKDVYRPIKAHIAKVLEETRKKKRKTQAEVAARAQVDLKTYSTMEWDVNRDYNIKTLISVVNALEIPYDELFPSAHSAKRNDDRTDLHEMIDRVSMADIGTVRKMLQGLLKY